MGDKYEPLLKFMQGEFDSFERGERPYPYELYTTAAAKAIKFRVPFDPDVYGGLLRKIKPPKQRPLNTEVGPSPYAAQLYKLAFTDDDVKELVRHLALLVRVCEDPIHHEVIKATDECKQFLEQHKYFNFKQSELV